MSWERSVQVRQGPTDNLQLRSQDELCQFCSFDSGNNNENGHRFEVKGISLDELVKSSTKCPSCREVNTNLSLKQCDIHDWGEGARLDVQLYPRGAHTYQPMLGRALSPDLMYAKMRHCLDECLASHPACLQDTDSGWLPTRLIEVTSSRPLLVPSFKIPRNRDRRYVALSHQWGPKPFQKLTKDTYELFREYLPYRALRRTFQDAITATRQLGIPYLWIDSLCIIQDLDEDWVREAAAMSLVYRNAIVTLAASTATHVEDGFFSAWSEEQTPTHLISRSSYSVTLDDSSVVTRQLHEGQVRLSKANTYPLSDRAWVVQEHLLSPRTIHFAQPIVWECRETLIKIFDIDLCIFPTEPSTKVWSAGLGSKDTLSLWKSTVTQYSACSLSRYTDRLDAIAGLAKVFASVMKTGYFAGLWAQSLAECLLWETTGNRSRRRAYVSEEDDGVAFAKNVQLPVVAPSWSWASVTGGVKFQTLPEGYTPLAAVKEAHTEPHALDDFGRIQSGYITVVGRLISLGKYDGFDNQNLLITDDFLRISLDDILSTDLKELYLLPIAQKQDERRYWSLLVTRAHSWKSQAIPEYKRLGLVMSIAEQPCVSATNEPWVPRWSHMFLSHAYTIEDYESPTPSTFRLV